MSSRERWAVRFRLWGASALVSSMGVLLLATWMREPAYLAVGVIPAAVLLSEGWWQWRRRRTPASAPARADALPKVLWYFGTLPWGVACAALGGVLSAVYFGISKGGEGAAASLFTGVPEGASGDFPSFVLSMAVLGVLFGLPVILVAAPTLVWAWERVTRSHVS